MDYSLDKLVFKPPYVSVSKMEELFSLLGNRSFSEISVQDLVARGFSTSDATQGIQGLKFLGVLDSKGKTTESMITLSIRGDARKEGLKNIVKEAYKNIFNTIPNIESLTRDELYNEFVAQYKLSSRLASTAVPVFIWLCKEAGIGVSDKISLKSTPKITTGKKTKTIQKKPEKRPLTPTIAELGNSSSSDYHSYDLSGIILNVPKSPIVDDEIAAGGLATIRSEIINFAKKVGLNQDVQGKTEDKPEEKITGESKNNAG